ncbi:MAG: AEC family transporter [Oscillospiraceae bacterium]|nr:AEC family transporter [Oscillospiraceae bacterium]
MLDILAFSLNATLPVILFMVLGIVSRRFELLDAATAKKLNNLCFLVFLPGLLFYNVYNIDFTAEFSLGLVIYAAVTLAVMICLLSLILFPILGDRARAATYVHILCRSNYIMFGIAIAQNMFGEPGLRVAAMLIPVALIIFNFAAVILLSVGSIKEAGSTAVMIKEVLSGLIKNPLIVTSIVATLISVSGLVLPVWLYTTSRSLSNLAAPFCLIILGAQIDWKNLRENVRLVTTLTSARLIFVPLIMVPVAVYFGFRGPALAALFALYASPLAHSAAVMAQRYDVHAGFTTQVLAMSTVLGGFTNFVGIYILRYFELF